MRQLWTRILVVLTLGLGTWYLAWRWTWSINWDNWWISVPLVAAETYALIDCFLFSLTVWRIKERGAAPPPPPGATVDVCITTYDEPIEMVLATAEAAQRIRYPHKTWLLDDGNRPELEAAAREMGIGYLTRHEDWRGRPRHAKAGNLNNALFATDGEFMLVMDADQVPHPDILDKTLGWFTDPEVALVQTPQYFTNVPEGDPLGSQAPLFYGPIQQGKDGWNAAFFCGSNAVLRREALMQLGIVGYVREVEEAVEDALRASRRILTRAARRARRTHPEVASDLQHLRDVAQKASRDLRAGAPVAEVTYAFQKTVDEVSRSAVARDFAAIQSDLEEIAQLPMAVDQEVGVLVVDDMALDQFAERDFSPLGALGSVQRLIRAVDVDRSEEAQPVMPMATVSVTEDMATSMRLHTLGWKSVYHHEILAHGLAPEDLGTMLRQRLRWAQGTLQVLLKENPLTQRGLTVGQALMYFSTMWSYLSGFASVVFLTAPVLYLCFGVLPVNAYGMEFLLRFLPYVLMNQVLFLFVGHGKGTWRGHQYTLALFPVWIRATTTAVADVFFKMPLKFAVTPKTKQEVEGFPWRLVWPQTVATALIAVACVVGVVRLATGAASSTIGTGVNVGWVVYDLVVMSIIFRAALHKGTPADRLEELKS